MPHDAMMDLYRRNPKEGFMQLYRHFAPRLEAYAVSAFRVTAQTAEDLIHDAFLPWVEDPERMGAVENPSGYLFASVRNGFLRRRRRSEDLPGDLGEHLAAAAGPDPDAGHDVQAALARLPEEQREVVVLRIWGDLTLAEVAAQQGVPLQTAASRYRYAMARLKEWLAWTE